MRANKHLETCTENCKYNTNETCAFSLRTEVGCYLDEEVRLHAARLFAYATEIDSIEVSSRIAKGLL